MTRQKGSYFLRGKSLSIPQIPGSLSRLMEQTAAAGLSAGLQTSLSTFARIRVHFVRGQINQFLSILTSSLSRFIAWVGLSLSSETIIWSDPPQNRDYIPGFIGERVIGLPPHTQIPVTFM